MNSGELRNILDVFVPKSFVTGVYASDQLNFIKSPQFAVVFNNESSKFGGMHWLAMWKSKDTNVIQFFDSFAMPLDFYAPSIADFIRKNSGAVVSSCQQIQSDFSEVCGQFCIYFLAKRISGMSFEEILGEFTTFDLRKNDTKVMNFALLNFTYPTFSAKDSIREYMHTIAEVEEVVQCCRKRVHLICQNK